MRIQTEQNHWCPKEETRSYFNTWSLHQEEPSTFYCVDAIIRISHMTSHIAVIRASTIFPWPLFPVIKMIISTSFLYTTTGWFVKTLSQMQAILQLDTYGIIYCAQPLDIGYQMFECSIVLWYKISIIFSIKNTFIQTRKWTQKSQFTFCILLAENV